jgi:peptide/nickel transport system substrate-binding protein
MSLAINRDEINEVIFFGKAEPAQSTVDPGCSYYKEEWARAYAQYDPERANKLLDEMGLDWEKNHRWRLRSDGKPLSISMPIVEGMAPVKLYELVGEYWREVGVRVNIKIVQRSFYGSLMLGHGPRIGCRSFGIIYLVLQSLIHSLKWLML